MWKAAWISQLQPQLHLLPQRVRYAQRNAPPPFIPVPTRRRQGGWDEGVQCAFLAQLYLCGSVSVAAKRVGRSRESAHRLRRKPWAESFAAAWDHVLAGPTEASEQPPRRSNTSDWRKVTISELKYRFETGFWRPVIYRGRMTAIAQKPDNFALLRLVRRMDGIIEKMEEEEL